MLGRTSFEVLQNFGCECALCSYKSPLNLILINGFRNQIWIQGVVTRKKIWWEKMVIFTDKNVINFLYSYARIISGVASSFPERTHT